MEVSHVHVMWVSPQCQGGFVDGGALRFMQIAFLDIAIQQEAPCV